MTRLRMMNNAIRKYGFEHPWVIQFCKFCEEMEDKKTYNDELKSLYIAMMIYEEAKEE